MAIWIRWCVLAIALIEPAVAAGNEADVERFFYRGDGKITLAGEKSGVTFAGRYRKGRGDYDPKALGRICRVFQAPCGKQRMALSLRLIEFIDYLEDRLRPGARITITSGYRDPQYNRSLRDRGAIAAKASLHQYGMAADLTMEGVPAKRIWETVKALGFGGTGYYHGRTVHLDVGPARFWDEKTSGVGTGLSDENKLIGLVTEFDIYRPGERLLLRFIRMTAFPIGVEHRFYLERVPPAGADGSPHPFSPAVSIPSSTGCLKFAGIEQMSALSWRLPRGLQGGRYRVRVRFCSNPWEKMPGEIASPPFQLSNP